MNIVKNLSKTCIDKINTIENFIKTTIQKIEQDDKLNNLINNEINTKINLNNLFEIKYYNKGLCSLQNIITSYFYNILDGLEFSLPAFIIFKNKK